MTLDCEDITYSEDWQQEVSQRDRIKKGEIDSFKREKRYVKKNQEIFWVNLTLMALRNEAGEILYALGMVEDITERKQAEAEMLKALEKERELGELRSGFVSLVSHEFRTPLTTIQSSAELVQRYSQKLSDERKLNHLIRIQGAVKRMTQLLEDVLTIGRAEAGKLEFQPAPMDLAAFCHKIVENMQELADEEHISSHHQHRLTLVTQGDCSNVQMDAKLLEHIVSNLLSNGLKYSPEGGTVQFDLICDGESAVFHIRDCGIGIPQKDLEQLFESL
jgi:signal transduction histidine kinase